MQNGRKLISGNYQIGNKFVVSTRFDNFKDCQPWLSFDHFSFVQPIEKQVKVCIQSARLIVRETRLTSLSGLFPIGWV